MQSLFIPRLVVAVFVPARRCHHQQPRHCTLHQRAAGTGAFVARILETRKVPSNVHPRRSAHTRADMLRRRHI